MPIHASRKKYRGPSKYSARKSKKTTARGCERTPMGKLNKRSFQYTRSWYTLWLVNFDRVCQHSSVAEADEICNMVVVRDLSTSYAVFKSKINNNTLEEFPYLECLREEQKDCMKNMVNGNDIFAILSTGFRKSLIFQLFPQVIMSLINVIDSAASRSMVIQLSIALVAIMKDQVEQLNKIRAVATTIGIDEEAAKNRNFKIVCQMGLTDLHDYSSFVTSVCAFADICRSVFSISTFHFAEFDTSVIQHYLFKLISIARYG